VKFLLSVAIVLGSAACALAQIERLPLTDGWLPQGRPWSAPQTPHPSVARIIVPERDGVAYGSGTLVDVNDRYGLVVTNWHVVEAAARDITVVFPDGFRSAGYVLKTDRDWDLAAVAIWKPKTLPVRLANEAPKPGELLTIAGYGSGDYRTSTGRCTQYVAPGMNFPYEMVEVAARARQGDSGGPIFNSRGELCGVLFGEGHGRTSGSYCGRVHQFLSSMVAHPGQLDSQLARGASHRLSPEPGGAARQPIVSLDQPSPRRSTPPAAVAAVSIAPPANPPSAASESEWRTASRHWAEQGTASVIAPAPEPSNWEQLTGDTPLEQVKTSLAIVGALALVFQVLRLAKIG
jgi:serine protease Do